MKSKLNHKNELLKGVMMKKFRIIISILCVLMLFASVTVVSAASLHSKGRSNCPTVPPTGGTTCGCKVKDGVSGLFCRSDGKVGNYTSSCSLVDYWDCPGNTCHCAALMTPDHCCADWGDCRPGE